MFPVPIIANFVMKLTFVYNAQPVILYHKEIVTCVLLVVILVQIVINALNAQSGILYTKLFVSCPNSCGLNYECYQCSAGYYLQEGFCVSCPYECASCSDFIGCIQCISGYYLSDGFCEICEHGCITCFSSSYCRQCLIGY